MFNYRFTMLSRLVQCLLAVFALMPLSSALAGTTLYEVTKGNHRVLLGGTIHLLHPDEFPLPDAFDAAYAEADALYLEADLVAVQKPEFAQRLMQAMLYPPGKSLNTELSPAVWERLKAYSETNGFPVQNFLGFDPAFVSMVMTVMAAQQKGISDGVDAYYLNRAHRDGLPTGYLEDSDAVLSYMEALSGQNGDDIIEATLADLKRFDELMTSTVEAWRRGDLDTLDQELGAPMRREAPEMYDILMVKRNAEWLPEIERLFNDEAVELVLVGSLHLAGGHSLLTALKKRGYQVRPYQGPTTTH